MMPTKVAQADGVRSANELLNQNFKQMSNSISNFLQDEEDSLNLERRRAITGRGQLMYSYPMAPFQQQPCSYGAMQSQPPLQQYLPNRQQSNLHGQYEFPEPPDTASVPRNIPSLANFNVKGFAMGAPPTVGALPMMASVTQKATTQNKCVSSHHYRNGSGYGNRQFSTATNKEIDYDNVIVSLEELGIDVDSEQTNPVLRLFNLFKNLDLYLSTTIFDYDDDDVGFGNVKTLPRTMNVHLHIKHGVRRCTIFITDMEHIIDAHKLKDRAWYEKCEDSLNRLRKVMTEFDSYKFIQMEHRRNQFVDDDAKMNSKCLEICVQRLIDLVRECHINIHIFNWSMEKRNQKQSQQIEQLLQPSQTAPNNGSQENQNVTSAIGSSRRNYQRALHFIG